MMSANHIPAPEKKLYDWASILLYLGIVLFGWLNIYAACYDEAHASVFDFSRQHGKQILWMASAFLIAVCILLIHPRVFSNGSYIIYGIVLLLLVATLFIGTVTNGGQSWIDFGAFKFQPSEFAKFATALALSKYISAIDIDLTLLRTRATLALMVLVPAGLILLQHDTGSALVFLAFLLPFFREGLSHYILLIGLLAILIICNHAMKQIVRPINRLINTTQNIVDGQYDETIPITPRKGVVAQLQNSFAKMQQSLNERMSHLRQEADELKQNNEEISRAKQEAENTINKKNKFIVRMTQQMRMPLNVISGFADVLAEKGVVESISQQKELDNIATMMKNNVISMNRMELMMLDASETDASGLLLFTRFHEVSCNKIAREVIYHVQRHYPHTNIQFETELQDTIDILTYRVFLLCVLIEPLFNAVNYSDGKHISLRVSQTDTTVVFTIQDTGPGLPADLPDMVYEPYTLPEDMPEGVGLGLPLARRHAKHLGGKLTIDPDYHDGCRIVIEMPK